MIPTLTSAVRVCYTSVNGTSTFPTPTVIARAACANERAAVAFIAAGFGFVSPARTRKTNGTTTGRHPALRRAIQRTADDSVRSPVIPHISSRPRTAKTNPSQQPCRTRDGKVLECHPSDSEGCCAGAMDGHGWRFRIEFASVVGSPARRAQTSQARDRAKPIFSSQWGRFAHSASNIVSDSETAVPA